MPTSLSATGAPAQAFSAAGSIACLPKSTATSAAPRSISGLRRIYRLWLEERRDHAGTSSPPDGGDARFVFLFRSAKGQPFDAYTAGFLRSLPPAQRLTLLLVYGERFDPIDAGRVLDVSAETIGARLVRITGTFADRLSANEERGGAGPREGMR